MKRFGSRPVAACVTGLMLGSTSALAAEVVPTDDEAGGGAAVSPVDQDATTHDRPGWLILPVVSYSPETSLQLGGYVMRYFRLDPKSHRSTIGGMATATLKRQVIIEVKPTLYFAEGSRRLDAHLEVQRFPDRFFGIGGAANHASPEKYERRMARLVASFRTRIDGSFSVGPTTDQLIMAIDADDPEGLLATRDYVGEEGGFSSGIGMVASLDTRDEVAFTTRGTFVEAKLLTYLEAWGSEYQLSRATIDARHFVPTGQRQALGFRYVSEFAGGTPPFYQLPTWGGANSMRGYFYGKYRDLMAHSLEAEYRARLAWRFGAALFASVGQVGPHPRGLVQSALRPAVGGGLRFDLSGSEGFNLRADAAGWSQDFGVYLAVMEAF
jgi:hypothetical protein